MLQFDPSAGLIELQSPEVESFFVNINGTNFKISKLEGIIISSKIKGIIENDRIINSVTINIPQERVFKNLFIIEDFNDLIKSSFDKIVNSIRGITNVDMSLGEICCGKAILQELGSRSLVIDDGKYRNITRNNAIEILNTLGNDESVNYVATNIQIFDTDSITPQRLARVLTSTSLELHENQKFDIVKRNIEHNGISARFLLEYINPKKLSLKERLEYTDLIISFVSSTQEELNENEIETILTLLSRGDFGHEVAVSKVTIDTRLLGCLLCGLRTQPDLSFAKSEVFTNTKFGEFSDLKNSSSLTHAAWAYSYLTCRKDYYVYGAAQIFEYVSLANSTKANTKSCAGNKILSELDNKNHNRQYNWDKLKNDPAVGGIAQRVIRAHYDAANALKKSRDFSNVEKTIQSIMDSIHNFLLSDNGIHNDFKKTVNAFKETYLFFVNHQKNGEKDGVPVFSSILNGTQVTSYGSMLASMVLSLVSIKQVICTFK